MAAFIYLKTMKFLQFAFLFHLMLQPSFQNGLIAQKQKMIVFDHAKSSIEIMGTTNVSDFGCAYNVRLPKDTLMIALKNAEKMLEIKGASLRLPIKSFKCDNSPMTSDFRKLLKAEEHPYINIKLIGIYKIESLKNHAEIAINIAGVQKHFTIATHIEKTDEAYLCEGNPELCITDFGIEAPEKFFGMVKVNEDITVAFSLSFSVYEL